jgi:hypothetical protein
VEAYIEAEVGSALDHELADAVGREDDEGDREESGRTLLETVLLRRHRESPVGHYVLEQSAGFHY